MDMHTTGFVTPPPPLSHFNWESSSPGDPASRIYYCKDDGAASHEFLYEINQEKEVVASVRMRRGCVWDTDDHVKSEGCIEVDRCATPCPRVA
jgi:hypothetical protein